jgi:hypothetical protein
MKQHNNEPTNVNIKLLNFLGSVIKHKPKHVEIVDPKENEEEKVNEKKKDKKSKKRKKSNVSH